MSISYTPDNFTDLYSTTLSAPLASATATTGTLSVTGNVPPAVPFYVTLGADQAAPEVVRITGLSGTNITSMVRNADGKNNAQAWAAGTHVDHCLVAAHFTNLSTALGAVVGAANHRALCVDDLGAGTADDTTIINDAISALAGAGGGTLLFGNKTYYAAGIILQTHVTLAGQGVGATVLKLKNGANGDLIWGGSANAALINLGAGYGSNVEGTLAHFTLRDLTLDGNKANQTAGPSYPLRVYAYGYTLQNVIIQNGYSGGVLSDWNSNNNCDADMMCANWNNVKIHDNNLIGFQFGGPHDSRFLDVEVWDSGSHNIHFAQNAAAVQVTNAHAWGNSGQYGNAATVGYLVESGDSSFVNCQAEGAGQVLVAFICAGSQWIGGRVFSDGSNGYQQSGFQIGQQAGQTPWYGQTLVDGSNKTTAFYGQQNRVNTLIDHCEGSNGAIWMANDGGGNDLDVTCWQTSGTAISGYTAPTTSVRVNVIGLTADGSFSTSGGMQFGAEGHTVLAIADTSGSVMLGVNTENNAVDLPNNACLRGWWGDYGGVEFEVNPDGNGSFHGGGYISGGESSTADALATGGSIPTDGLFLSRVAPTANVTGVILPQPSKSGTMLTVVNESAYSITFAASATSNVADGVSDVIAAQSARTFVYDAGTSLWYRCQ